MSDIIQKGIITKGLGGLYEVKLNDGERVSCKARGVFRHEKTVLCVGDKVDVKITNDGCVVERIHERKNSLIRPPMANLDILFIVIAAKKPSPALSMTDKLISIAEYNKIEPVIIVSKSDLDESEAQHIACIYKKSGFNTFVSGLKCDMASLRKFVTKEADGKLSAFAGASGVGKSTMINSLFPKLALETGEVSKKTERGRHTTRHVELYELSYLADDASLDGYIADTPGFSLLDFIRFDFFDKEDLPYTFREFEQYIGKCKYTKCSHTSEEGCKIVEAVKNGTIPSERHNSYTELFNDLKNKHSWDK